MQETSLIVNGSTSFVIVQSQLKFGKSSSNSYGKPTEYLKPGIYLEKTIKYVPGSTTPDPAPGYSFHLLMDNMVDPDIESGEEIIQTADISNAGIQNAKIRLYFRESNDKLYSISVLYEDDGVNYEIDLLEKPAIGSYYAELPINGTFKLDYHLIASLVNTDNVRYYLVSKPGSTTGTFRLALINVDYLQESFPLNPATRSSSIGIYYAEATGHELDQLDKVFSLQNLSESVESLYTTLYDKFTTR